MSRPGVGAMLHYLSGGSEHSPEEFYGKTVTAVALEDERLKITFSDGERIAVWDDGQSCCESRYTTTDDDVACLIGGELTKIEAKETREEPDGWGEHEIVFVEVATTKGSITLAAHNEHNGYYGGFGLTITKEAA